MLSNDESSWWVHANLGVSSSFRLQRLQRAKMIADDLSGKQTFEYRDRPLRLAVEEHPGRKAKLARVLRALGFKRSRAIKQRTAFNANKTTGHITPRQLQFSQMSDVFPTLRSQLGTHSRERSQQVYSEGKSPFITSPYCCYKEQATAIPSRRTVVSAQSQRKSGTRTLQLRLNTLSPE